ncbi:DNA alkylation repair protein [Betaproteobacteria bacterium]|nr:DNA alkylation repair protein [Betaproteobacteria bacterium]GHU16529.1 DNA alkylation repair protein [Betaproteobacteria bacterium]
MEKKFKDYYDEAYADMLAGRIAAVLPTFSHARFMGVIAGQLEDKAFLERMDVFARALESGLPGAYPAHISALHPLLGDELDTEAGMFTQGWWLWPVARYVEKHATEDFAASVSFIRELTKRHTGEFAVRPLLAAFPVEMMAVMLDWSRDENVHVRRLSSEGVRIRLPWAKKLLVALERFEDYRAILGNLKDDASRFVQKSVGNNLNDLYKEAPAKAEEIIASWERDAPLSRAAQWIVRHGRRNVRR